MNRTAIAHIKNEGHQRLWGITLTLAVLMGISIAGYWRMSLPPSAVPPAVALLGSAPSASLYGKDKAMLCPNGAIVCFSTTTTTPEDLLAHMDTLIPMLSTKGGKRYHVDLLVREVKL